MMLRVGRREGPEDHRACKKFLLQNPLFPKGKPANQGWPIKLIKSQFKSIDFFVKISSDLNHTNDFTYQ